jgi:hypothetical protein
MQGRLSKLPLLLLLGIVTHPVQARAADGVMITADSAVDAKIRMDGIPGELPGVWSNLGTTISGKRSLANPKCALAYDDDNLYVAMKIDDKKIIRSASAGSAEDHATLRLAFPLGKGQYHTYVVELFPGDPGKLPGVVRVSGRAATGAQLVEAPEPDGLTFEAKVPWKNFAEAARTRVGLRAAMEWTDAVAAGKIGSITATSRGKEGKELPQLLTEPEQAIYDGLIRAQQLPTEPAREVVMDVAGDALYERVALYDHFLTIVGTHFRGGKEFVVADLQIQDSGKLKQFQHADFDGDGHEEIVAVVRLGSEDHYRDVVEVLRVDTDNSLKPVYLHEVGLTAGSGAIQNEVKIGRNGGRATLVIAQGSAEGVEQQGYSEPKPSDMESALLPWDPIGSQTFAWQGGHLVKTGETTHTPAAHGSGKVAKSSRTQQQDRSASTNAVAAPPPPRPPSSDELMDQVYALYRKDRHVKKGKPRFDFVTDVAGDTTTERVLIHERDIVCFGKNFREGTSYVYASIGVGSPEDIVDVTARDLTGDGKAEAIVLAVLHAKGGKELDDAEVDRSVLFVFQISENGIRRIFAAETGRGISDKWVLSGVRLMPKDAGTQIELTAGRAVGFTAKTYPFPDETEASGGVEPVVLPWSRQRSRTYRFNGERFSIQ